MSEATLGPAGMVEMSARERPGSRAQPADGMAFAALLALLLGTQRPENGLVTPATGKGGAVLFHPAAGARPVGGPASGEAAATPVQLGPTTSLPSAVPVPQPAQEPLPLAPQGATVAAGMPTPPSPPRSAGSPPLQPAPPVAGDAPVEVAPVGPHGAARNAPARSRPQRGNTPTILAPPPFREPPPLRSGGASVAVRGIGSGMPGSASAGTPPTMTPLPVQEPPSPPQLAPRAVAVEPGAPSRMAPEHPAAAHPGLQSAAPVRSAGSTEVPLQSAADATPERVPARRGAQDPAVLETERGDLRLWYGALPAAAESGAHRAPAAVAAGGAEPAPGHPPAVRPAELGLLVVRAAQRGIERFTVQLEPASLGRIEVGLVWAGDGRLVSARIRSHRPETLARLREEASDFLRIFARHGVDLGAEGLSFELLAGEGGDGEADSRQRGAGGRGMWASASPGRWEDVFRFETFLDLSV